MKKKKEKELVYYPEYSIISFERKKANDYILEKGYEDGLTHEKADSIWNEEYLFLKKLKRVNDISGGYGLAAEKRSIVEDTEFGQVFIQLIDRLNWKGDIQDVLDAGLQKYFADGVTGFEALRRLMMIKGMCLIGAKEACSEEYFLKSMKEFFPEEKK